MSSALRETVKQLHGCAILTLPSDVDDELLHSLASQFYSYAMHEDLLGVVFDFSNLRALDCQLAEGLFIFAKAVSTLGLRVEVCCICPGVASSLALLGFDARDISISRSLTASLDAIHSRSGLER